MTSRSSDPPKPRLIRRQKLVPDPRYIVRATADNTTVYAPPPRGHLLYALIGEISEIIPLTHVRGCSSMATLERPPCQKTRKFKSLVDSLSASFSPGSRMRTPA